MKDELGPWARRRSCRRTRSGQGEIGYSLMGQAAQSGSLQVVANRTTATFTGAGQKEGRHPAMFARVRQREPRRPRTLMVPCLLDDRPSSTPVRVRKEAFRRSDVRRSIAASNNISPTNRVSRRSRSG